MLRFLDEPSDKATVAITATMKREAWMFVSMKGTQGLVVAHLEPQCLSNLLDRQVLKLLNIEF